MSYLLTPSDNISTITGNLYVSGFVFSGGSEIAAGTTGPTGPGVGATGPTGKAAQALLVQSVILVLQGQGIQVQLDRPDFED